MNKKKTEEARVLAGVEFGKWLLTKGATASPNTIVEKQVDTERAYGLENNDENWEAVGKYSINFLLNIFEAVTKN